MSRLAQGSYHLKVYYANPYMKYDESSMAYNGLVNLAQNSKASVTLNPEMLLPNAKEREYDKKSNQYKLCI